MANVVCAWCKGVIRNDFPGDFDSHGICDRCLAELVSDGGSIEVGGRRIYLASEEQIECGRAEELALVGGEP